MKQFIKNNALLIGGFLIIVVLLFDFRKKIFGSSSVFGNGVDFVSMDDSVSKMSAFEAKRIAEALYESMYTFGTDEKKIFNLLKGISINDYSKVYNEFGTRYYQEYFGTWSDALVGVKLDLNGWLENELTSEELLHLSSVTNGLF